jgi:protein-tyrosine phosphatase
VAWGFSHALQVQRHWDRRHAISWHWNMNRKVVLFLCTGNYYRSRFAELLFNHLAAQSDLDWLAMSRALALDLGACNVGPISQAAVKALAERGIPLGEKFRYPTGLEENDLAGASHIVAVKWDEHLPLLKRRFPLWVERVEFWRVHDIDLLPPREALAEIDRNVRKLIERLRRVKQTGEQVVAGL